ncbi:cilia- and flagella-associated protein 47-like [Sphaeramia orbicularis]|uniref:cilia- and flagella-associated protein 47-like n=1 Tax=Sphaeramia orbicularis TaxID=375764 RepID=UPI00117C7988|nr:cilia- and flagella-associated protein 47 [Sphaeramia orbicularis]
MAVNCVRVDPPFVQFNDVRLGQVYKTALTVTNVGKTMTKIAVGKPNSKMFKFTSSSSAVVVAPGLGVNGLLEFTPEREEEVRGKLQIHIDDTDTMEIPLLAFPRACSLIMESVVDFGCVAANSQVISKYHPITNQGSAPGMFQVQFSGNPAIKLSPINGVIAAGATQWLKAELRTDASRLIDERAMVKLQNCSTILCIRAHVVAQPLEIFDLQGSPLSSLWFGPVYFGTSRVENIVLRNNSPQPCDWVCVFQEAAAGTEVGTNLQNSTDATLVDRIEMCSSASEHVSQVLVCVPKQGRLGPCDKTTVALRFSPVSHSAHEEKPHVYSTRRQDYCLFLLFESVGSKHGFTHHTGNSSVELAVTGSGLPVSLVPSPSHRFDFHTCMAGQRVDLLCVLQNFCPQLPINFSFRKVAHFSTEPSTGTIAPGQCQDVVLSFKARQQGTFQVCQWIDILGYVIQQRGDNTTEDSTVLQLQRFYTLTLNLSAVCCHKTTHPVPKLNSGITPAVTNPSGLYPYVRSSELAHCREMVRTAVLSADKTRLHKHHNDLLQNTEEEEFLAFPNDRASSIRPASPHRHYRTIFTGVHRYHYVDTDYAFTVEEEVQRKQHCQIYADYIKKLRSTRLQKLKERQQPKVEDDVDIGIVPFQGLVPPKLCIKDMETSNMSHTSPESKKKPYIKRKGICLQDVTSTKQQITSQVVHVVNAVPSTSQEMAECNRTLTAQELYQVDIGPLLVDFGEVCVQSVCVQTLDMINHLSVHVWVQLDVDCPELQGSSPVSHVLPPRSHTTLPLTFQSNKLGEFYRPLSYSVNQKHPGQILVQAQVVPVALELSPSQLVLHPTSSLLAQSGYRSSVTLQNHRNHAAEFTWQPVVTENGILFSVRPATGTVEAYKELDCEVVWHASFSSPPKGDFDLCVLEGNTQHLHCIAKVGCTSVQLAENRVTFESVSLKMTSVRTAVLHNTGQNHAYYQVLDVCPLPGMVVSPSEGLVPAGGQAVLNIHFNPDSVIRFDTRIEIALRNMKSIELRVDGSVEPPNVDLNISDFQLFGVFIGSRRSAPFTLTNHSSAAASVTFDLTKYRDFLVQLPDQSTAEQEPGVSVVEIRGSQEVNCSLVFSPTQVASYDFDLPVMVNGVSSHPSSPSSLPTSSSSFTSCSSTAGSKKMTVKLVPQPVPMATSPRRIQATVLHAPVEMSPSTLIFYVKPLDTQADDYTKTVHLKAETEGNVCWGDEVQPNVCWWVDCSSTATLIADREEEICKVSPSSGSLGPGQSICLTVSLRPEATRTVPGTVIKLTIPVYLGDQRVKGLHPYRELSVTIHHRPIITIHPPQILLTPVPLGSNSSATLTLLASGYPSGTQVSAEVCDVELEDGTKIQPVSIIFPQGNYVPAQDMNQVRPRTLGVNKPDTSVASLICNVSFSCAIPLTICTDIIFTDHLQNRFKVKICAMVDNCVLTVWPYMASHCSDQQIVLKTGATAVEAVLQHYHIPSPTSCPNSSSSTFDHNSSTNKTSGTDSFPDSDSGQASGDEQFSSIRDTPTNQGVPEFPSSSSAEGLYYQSVLLAVERWFTFFGWPSGPHPVSVPHTFRRVISTVHTSHHSGRAYRVTQNKDSRSAVDMLIHLTGKQIPGIPHIQSFSKDLNQRTNQLLKHYEAMLTFLSAQGACLCHIKPEYLLDKQEFNHWCSLQVKKPEYGVDYSNINYESLSKRSWTDVLLQIYKVFVLCRVSVGGLNAPLAQKDTDEIIPVCSQPLASNVYSPWELQLLSWLNKHYESVRKTVWGTGYAPSARWIVNFDLDLTDGLVLAALLAAYCPYLICSHFKRMYTRTSSLEQILHNNIIVVQALTTLCLNIDIHPTDLSDPNPVQMLMLCVHLFERLPQYLPLETITLSGELHSTFSKQVCLRSPTSKPIKYHAFFLGEHTHLFTLPNGCTVTIPAKTSTELTVQYRCSFLQSSEATLLLVSDSAFVTTLAFNLKTQVSHIRPKTVKCSSPCYKLKEIQLPVTNPFTKEGKFRVVLMDSVSNPLKPEKRKDLIQQAASKTKSPSVETMTDRSCEEETGGKCSDHSGEDSDFSCAVRSIFLKSGHTNTLKLHYLPFCPGIKYCSVLLVCPQVGDMVYMVKATAELPLPFPLTAKPSCNIDQSLISSDVCVSTISLNCKVGQVCEEVICVPVINMAWEQALAIWGQYSMSAEEHRRRLLTHSLHSSSVRAITAARKLSKQQTHLMKHDDNSKGIEYSVEVSLPQYFTLPNIVTIPIKETIKVPWKNPSDCGCVEIPIHFQAHSVGHFTCRVVLRSWCDTRVYMLEANVTSERVPVQLDFSSPAHRSVKQDILLNNKTDQDWKMQAELWGEGFSGPKVFHVAAGTKACYPLTFHPATQCIVKGKLSLHNDCDGTEHVFTLRGVGERPLPVDHIVLHCPAGQTKHTQLDVPNYSQNKLTLKLKTDLSIVSGHPYLEIKPGHSTPYILTVSPWKRGTQTGFLSFVETDDDKGAAGSYEVYFSLEVICKPAEPLKVINVTCVVQSEVAIEIPINNTHEEPLNLDVSLDGDDLSGPKWISVPPRGALTYKAMFSPDKIGKSESSVVFQSEMVGEFCYQLELYALPCAVTMLPQVGCQLGKWTRITLPLVNPTAETLELIVANSNPRNYSLEMDSGNTLILEPHSSSQLGVCFSPSSIGEGSHAAKITFSCPQLQEWCFELSGRGLNPKVEELVSISSMIGSRASINIPFTNPMELQAVLDLTLTDEDPKGALPSTTDKTVFVVPLSQTKGIQINAGASFNVPVVFAPTSVEIQRVWLCITMRSLSNDCTCSASSIRSDQDLSTICWIYPLCGIPLEVSAENPSLGVVQCEAGCQLEKKFDVQLSGCVLGSQDRKSQEVSQVMKEDFLCKVQSVCEEEHLDVEDCVSAYIEAASRDPESGNIVLTLQLVYSPVRLCRYSAVVVVQSMSGGIWEFPITLTATEPVFDDVIVIDANELDETSAVGFRFTSITRRPEPFIATFLPGSSSEFTVTPASGMLPPVGSAGALITVSFTPTSYGNRHRARLIIKAADMQWIYEVRGKTPRKLPPLCPTSSSVIQPASKQQVNFVVHNRRLPALANSSPLKAHR